MPAKKSPTDRLKVVLASVEMVPLVKVGGLADVTGALGKELVRLGHDVTVLMPRPGGASASRFGEAVAIGETEVRLGDRAEELVYERLDLGPEHPAVVFLRHDRFFDRPNPYVDPKTGTDWPDNAARFALFCKGIVWAITHLVPGADALHLNDYQTGLVPLFLREGLDGRPPGRRPGILYAIHNLGYQGIFSADLLDAIDPALDRRHFTPGGALEFYGKVNYMKAGIRFADLITTVSERYAREIQESEEHGFGLEGDLRARSDRVLGILNGIDTEIWNPETDPVIPHNYSASNLGPKRENKARLLESMELPAEPDLPVVGMISRLVDQKGFDLLEEAAETLLAMDLRLVVLGNGLPRYEEMMRSLRKRQPDRFSASLTFSEPLAHLIEAGSDFFLMPSRYEPCGLNQMYSLRYGTIPIVRATGGLADTVQDYDPATGRGSGFVFEEYDADAMVGALRRALAAYARPRAWKKLIATVMRIDNSWGKAARAYEKAYRRAMGNR